MLKFTIQYLSKKMARAMLRYFDIKFVEVSIELGYHKEYTKHVFKGPKKYLPAKFTMAIMNLIIKRLGEDQATAQLLNFIKLFNCTHDEKIKLIIPSKELKKIEENDGII